MKNKTLILLILSILLNLILLNPNNLAKLKIWAYSLYGFAKFDKNFKTKDTVLVSEYSPVSKIQKKEQFSPNNKYPIFETHGHLGKFFKTTPTEITKSITESNYSYFISLNLIHTEDLKKFMEEYNDPRILHFTTFHWKRLNEENGIEKMRTDLENDFKNGAKGVKLWKNFGLYQKDSLGKRIPLDDDRLSSLFETCIKYNKVVSIHTADPEAFFYPIDEKNERYLELLKHPDWSFLNSEISFDDLMEERNRLFSKYPKLIFIALHFGEFAHRLEDADRLLSNHPNVHLDIAARIDELGRQPVSTKKFMEKWKDRIIFGMDGPPDINKLRIYQKFLESDEEYFDYYSNENKKKGFWKIYGLKLNDEILKKIYFENAYRIFSINQ
jgi:uncharacterized protein